MDDAALVAGGAHALEQVRERRILRVAQRNSLWRKLRYVPHAKQRGVHNAITRGARIIDVVAGTRSGKTRSMSTELITEMAFGPPENAPHRLARIAAPYSELTDKAFKWCWNAIVTDNIFELVNTNAIKKSERERYIELPWGAKLVGSSMENPDSALGEGSVFTLCDEWARVANGKIFKQYIERELMDYEGVAVAISTPMGRNHYYKKWALTRKMMLAGDPLYFATRFTSMDNPHLPPGEAQRTYDAMMAAGSKDIADRELRALFNALAGAVYPDFDAARHVRNVEYDPRLPITLGVDWGFRNPAAVIFGQWYGDYLRVFDMIYAPGLTPRKLGKKVIAQLAIEYHVDPQRDDQFNIAYCDPSGASEAQEWEDLGIPTTNRCADPDAKLNDVQQGIVTVRELLARHKDEPDLEPGVVFDGNRCETLIEQLQALHFNEKKGHEEDERPVKAEDHAPDGFRYLVHGELGGSGVDDWGLPALAHLRGDDEDVEL